MIKLDESLRLKGECMGIASQMMRDFKNAVDSAQLLYYIALYQGILDSCLKDLLAVMKKEENNEHKNDKRR